MTLGYVESEAAYAMCALTHHLSPPSSRHGDGVQVQLGVCVPRHELITMQP